MSILNLMDIVQRVERCLGNSERTFCVLDGNDHSYDMINSARILLQKLDLECPRCHALSEAVEAHYLNYGCGCKTLVVLVGIWLRQAKKLIDMGIPATDIAIELEETLEYVKDVAKNSAIPVDFNDVQPQSRRDKVENVIKYPESGGIQTPTGTLYPRCSHLDGEDSDISWFFDDGKIPRLPTLDNEVVSHCLDIQCKSSKQIESGTSDIKVYGIVEQTGCLVESEDEFESCFDNVRFMARDTKYVSADRTRPVHCQEESDTKNVRNEQEYPISSLNKGPALGHATEDSMRTNTMSHREIENRINQLLASKKSDTRLDVLKHSRHLKKSHGDQFNNGDSYSNDFGNMGRLSDMDLRPNTGTHSREIVKVTVGQVLQSFQMKAGYVYHLLEDVYTRQINDDGRFKTDSVHCICIPGISHNQSCVEQGIILKTLNYSGGEKGNHRFLLLGGDLTPSYTHTGSKIHQKWTLLHNDVNTPTAEDIWCRKTIQILIELQVTVLFVKGMVTASLCDACSALNITILTEVPSHLMTKIGEMCRTPLLYYITDCTTGYLGSDITLEPFFLGAKKEFDYVTVKLRWATFQTAVICHPNQQIAFLREEQMWRSLNSLHHIFSTGVVLPGAGMTELFCARGLIDEALLPSGSKHCSKAIRSPVIASSLADGFYEFHSIIMQNSLDHNQFWDDLPSKIAAFEGAMRYVQLMLHIETEILTGILKSTTSSQVFPTEEIGRF